MDSIWGYSHLLVIVMASEQRADAWTRLNLEALPALGFEAPAQSIAQPSPALYTSSIILYFEPTLRHTWYQVYTRYSGKMNSCIPTVIHSLNHNIPLINNAPDLWYIGVQLPRLNVPSM